MSAIIHYTVCAYFWTQCIQFGLSSDELQLNKFKLCLVLTTCPECWVWCVFHHICFWLSDKAFLSFTEKFVDTKTYTAYFLVLLYKDIAIELMPLNETVLSSFFIPQGQKQIVGSESFPGARFIYFLIPVGHFQQLSCRGKSATARQEGKICYIQERKERTVLWGTPRLIQ